MLEQLADGYAETLGMVRNLNLRIKGLAHYVDCQARIQGGDGSTPADCE